VGWGVIKNAQHFAGRKFFAKIMETTYFSRMPKKKRIQTTSADVVRIKDKEGIEIACN
jgi:hypothetical protein